MNTATHNSLNQLTSASASSGPVKFAGRLSEAATVQVASLNATMGIQNTSFVGYAQATLGTNLVSIKATDYATNSATNVYQIIVTNNGLAKTLSYDINGNLTNAVTSTSTNKYEWDGADRLVRITQLSTLNPQLTTEFSYDGFGRRSRIIESTNGIAGSTNRFVWCEMQLCEERNGTGSTVTKRFLDDGEQIAGVPYFFAVDHLGSIREMTDTNGTVRARYEFDPYGRRTKVSGDLEADFAFTGHYYHHVSGLHLAPFRAYDSTTVRWLSRDPIEEDGGVNLYAYVRNSPIGAVDRLGLWDGDAIGAHQFWMGAAANGVSQGGILGNSKAAAASTMAAFIDFFAARNVQKHFTAAGSAAACGDKLEAAKELAKGSGWILLAAAAGWTGGGGAAAKGVKLKDLAWYELGSQTINGRVYQALAHMDKVSLGKHWVQHTV